MKIVTLSALLVLSSANSSAFTSKDLPTKPDGWDTPLSSSTTNVRIYKKTKSSAYMQVVDIKGGARIEFSTPKVIWDKKRGIPTATKYSLLTHWTYLSSPVSIVNGQFFDQNKDPTTLSFAVKSGGSILTLGQDKYSYDSKYPPKQMEITSGAAAYVQQWSEYRIQYESKAPNIIVGLNSDDSTKGPSTAKGRTAFCTNGKWIFIGTYIAETQGNVVKDLQTWGCTKENVVIFDGSGSTQLKVGNKDTPGSIEFKGDGRLIPQVVAVYNN